MADRPDFYLCTFALLTTLITGCSGQCVGDQTRPKLLFADNVRRPLLSPDDGKGRYPPNSDCAWRIKADRNHVIQLSHINVDLEHTPGCYDKITVYDGYSTYSNIMARFCTNQFETFYSSGRYMYVNFTSDATIEHEGFSMEYTSVPEGQKEEYTTRRPSHWMTTFSYTTTTSDNWQVRFNTTALTVGLVVGLMFVVILTAMCRRFCNRSAHRRPPGPAPTIVPPTSHTASRSGTAHHSDIVFMLSNGGYGRLESHSGNTNMGFSSYGDAPPPYDSLQHNDGAGQPTAPPSYSDAIRMPDYFATPKPE